MPNLTMTIDAQILKKVRKVAVERDTTITALVRAYLERLATKENLTTEGIVEELKRSFDKTNCAIGKRTWTREQLNER
jgi:hypothetical protein